MTSLRGLYAITDHTHPHQLVQQVEQAILGGAKVIQYRDKSTDPARRLTEASDILEVCQKHHVPLLINDDIALAAEIGADGVHLGADDSSLAEARAQLGSKAIIGISCYNQLALAQQAEAAGATYVAFGRFFASSSKPQAVQADIRLLKNAKAQINCPIVAIGGITAQNGHALIEAGADMLAVIHGVFGADDIQTAAQNIHDLFEYEMPQDDPA
jgi:thiamine-phosphate pyrophosphorylase